MHAASDLICLSAKSTTPINMTIPGGDEINHDQTFENGEAAAASPDEIYISFLMNNNTRDEGIDLLL